jgi:membrane fusion protein (multidrug efflux system)
MRWYRLGTGLIVTVGLLTAGCGGDDSTGGRGPGRAGGGDFPGGGFGGGREAAAVPVEVTPVERRDMASYIETNGTLEAEAEVDLVARTSGPIVELRAEENMAVSRGQLLARLDQAETRARLEVSRVNLQEAETAFARAEALQRASLLSAEAFEQARSALESARAEFQGNEIQLGYTEIRAPFAGLVVRRYVKFAETVSVNQPLFRLSDFDPLLCPIQVPERELPRLAPGQPAYVTVDAWDGERFDARVLRVAPVVEAATGTVKVTLEVESRGKLRPGMFASVYVQTDTHEGVLAIPRPALALDSIGDAVFVAREGTAVRREVELGVREGGMVEVVGGLEEGELVITVGQDSLSDGTPIEIPGDAPAGER